MKTARKSNYELMRIISMFLIVLSHVITHGRIIENTESYPGIREIFIFIKIITLVHVNSFVLLSGYFQCTEKFKQKKLWKIITEIIFYELVIMTVLIILKVIPFDKNMIIGELFPIELIFNSYWFMKYYIILYCLSPFINNAINSFTKKQFESCLLVLTLFTSLLPFLCGLNSINNNGYSIYHFIFLYLVGSYLRKYPIEDNYFGKRLSKNLLQLFFLLLMIFSILNNYILQKAGIALSGINYTLDIISYSIKTTGMLYNNPFVIIQSICYFYIFKNISISNKIINKLGNLVMGIYLIHDNHFLRMHLYQWLQIDNRIIYSYKFIVYALLISIFIFIASGLIEYIRQLLLKTLSLFKINYKIKQHYYNWFNSLYIHDNK